MPIKEGIVYFGVNAWDSIVQRPQHMAQGLSRNNPVLYVDPSAFSVLTKLNHSSRREKTVRGWKPVLQRLSDTLHVFTPPPLLPFSLWSGNLNRLNCRLLSRMLKGVFSRIRFRPSILWVSFPQSQPLCSMLQADLICFDCLDNYPAFYPDRRGRLLALQEKALLEQAQVVFATDRTLEERCRQRNLQVHRLPNAVHPRFLSEEGFPCPPDLADLPKPVIGYVGSVSHWIDMELIHDLAARQPRWTFAMVGPVSRSPVSNRPSNLHFLGEKSYDQMPAYMDHMDVCLIPFVVNELTNSVNPVKVYEYLARGKPVVASDTRGMAPFRKDCYIASGPDEFLSRIEDALRERGTEQNRKTSQRIEKARANTWEHRILEAETILGKLLDKDLS